jgi:hypothetical protein
MYVINIIDRCSAATGVLVFDAMFVVARIVVAVTGSSI